MGSVANGQSTINPQKSINKNTSYKKDLKETVQHTLNTILSSNENNSQYYQPELYSAIRPEKPPEVVSHPYQRNTSDLKGKGKSTGRTITKKATTRTELDKQRLLPNQPDISRLETDLPMEDIIQKPKNARRKRTPPQIQYDIVKDVLEQKANISIQDLIASTPMLRRQLASACRPPKRKSEKMLQWLL